MSGLATFFRTIKKFSYALVIIACLAFTVASHTVGFIANATGAVIHAVTGTATLLSDARTRAQASRARAASLDADLDATRMRLAQADVRTQTLTGELEELRARTARLDADLLDANRRITQLDVDLVNERRASANLQIRAAERSASPLVTFRGSQVTIHEANQTVTRAIQTRTRRTAVANVGSAVGESIPFYGIAIIVAATGYELNSACQTMRDLYDLELALNPGAEPAADRDYVCGLQVPTRDEIWQSILEAPGAAWAGTVALYEQAPEYMANLEAPDFGAAWNRSVAWVGSFFE